jgi:hypothetical protein
VAGSQCLFITHPANFHLPPPNNRSSC